jgi:hypothetical protein
MAALEATLAQTKSRGGDSRKQGETKDDLLERARKLDIDGRSKMTKDELAEAIAAAE